jgi:electron transport complex protein RnfA
MPVGFSRDLTLTPFEQYSAILISTMLVNNVVTVRLLGVCPVMGASRRMDAAPGVGVATAMVLTLSTVSSYLLDTYLLMPFGLQYLRTIGFIVMIAALVQLAEMWVRATNPRLHRVLRIFLPLMTTNCAVLGVALLNAQTNRSLTESLLYGLGTSLGLMLFLVLFAGVRERADAADVPLPFRGQAIRLITVGLASQGFLGLSGLGGG